MNSVITQTLKEIEIICINDGSTDNSLDILKEYAKKDGRIRIYSQHNRGQGTVRNRGIDLAKGEYVYFMDPDDLLVDNALSVLLKRAQSTAVDILMADYCKFNDGEDYSQLTQIRQDYSETLKSAESSFLEDLSPYECYVWLMLIRRSFLIDNRIEFKPFWYEDTLLCQECFIKASTVLRTHFILYVYRMREGSFTSSMNLKKMLDLNSCLSALNEIRCVNRANAQVTKKLSDNIFASFSYGLWCIVHNDELYAQRGTIISDLRKKIRPSSFVFRGNMKQLMVSYAFRFFPFMYLSLRRIC